jgi:integrase
MRHHRDMAKRRRRGEGTVFASGGLWEARLSLGVTIVNGKARRHQLREKHHTEADAWAALDRMRAAHQSGVIPERQTLDAYLRGWLAYKERNVRPSTAASYRGHIENHIGPMLGGIVVSRLRATDVRRLIADRIDAGCSPATVGLIVTTLRMALKAGVDDRVLTHNVAASVQPPRVEREPVRAMTPADADAIRAAVAGTFMEPLVALILGSGMRLGEACGLDWGDVDLDAGYVVIRRTKTRVRATPISEDAVAALRAHRAAAKRIGAKVPVFLGPRTNERLTTMTVSHAFPKVLEAAGLPRLTVHGLRHGVASMLVAEGVHMRVVADQLGHANVSMTSRYAHIVPQHQVDALRVLNRRKA